MRVIALSFACNNACIFCAQGKLRETSPSFDAEASVRDAAGALAAGETVALVGGEPTLDERLPSFLRTLDAAGAGRIVVQTNGRRLAYRSYARALREASARVSLDVSLAGSTEAMHDYHTATPGSFKQAVLGLRNARAEKLPASVSCVVTRSNFRHLSEIVRLCAALSVVGLRFVPAQPLGSAGKLRDRVVPAAELLSPYLTLALAEAKKLGLAVRVDASGAAEDGAAGAFAGLGPVEAAAEPSGDRARGSAQDGTRTSQGGALEGAKRPQGARRSLAIFGRPAPGRREERTPGRKSGDELRSLFPTLFDGAEPRDVADVVAAERAADQRRSEETG
jgi:pyruvate-formate lyase-activating enzyme